MRNDKMQLMPSGGVKLETTTDFLMVEASVLAAGGVVVGPKLIHEGLFNEIKSNAQRFISVIANARSQE